VPDIIPEVTVDDQSAAAANVTEIDKAIGTWRTQAQAGGQGGRILFPPGKVWISQAIFLYETEAGITLEGQGWNQDSQVPPQFDPGATGNTLILNSSSGSFPGSMALWITSQNIGHADHIQTGYSSNTHTLTLTEGDLDNYVVDDYVFLFHDDPYATERNPCQTLTITGKNPGPPPTITFEQEVDDTDYKALKYLKNSRGVSADVEPGDTSVTLAGSGGTADAAKFAVGDYVLLSDGVGINEVFGEYLKVAKVTVNGSNKVIIDFTTGVAGVNGATYAAAKTVLIPGPWPKGITVRNLQIGSNRQAGQNGCWGIKFAPDFRAENVRTWLGDPSLPPHAFGATNCAYALFLNCQFEMGAATNSCHDVRFLGCTINGFYGEEWSRNLYHIANEITTFCRTFSFSYGFNFSGCRFRRIVDDPAGAGFALAHGGQHTLLNCQFDSGGTTSPICYVSGGRSTLAHLRGDVPLIVADTDNALIDLTLKHLTLAGASTGTAVPPITTTAGVDIHPTANWVVVPNRLSQVGDRLAYGTRTPGAELSIVGAADVQVGVHILNTDDSGYSALRLGNDVAFVEAGFAAHYFNGSWNAQPYPVYAANGATMTSFGSAGLTLHANAPGAPIRFFTGGQAAGNERLRIADDGTRFLGNVGFFGNTPVSKPEVTGSKGGNAALASLLTALANLGLVTNSTTETAQ
jgi:hypothetical protein